MVERRTPIQVREAVQRVMGFSLEPTFERVKLEQAMGRFLAEDLIATHDVPSFDRSPYDGFAIRSEDTVGATAETPVTFEVVGHIGAGFVYEAELKAQQAVRIMTGAPIPKGSDAVIMLELVNERSNEMIEIKRKVKKHDNISFQGEDTKKGTVLVEKGTQINPGTIALLATFGYSEVAVAKRVKMGVMATGSELLDVDEELVPGKIRNSNTPMVMAQIERAGGEAVYLGKLDDDFDSCYEAVKKALHEVDVLITTGGVSVGDFDFIPEILKKLEANVLFNKIAMRPGSVTTVALLPEGKVIYGLSGNPSACYVGFELFVRPILRKAFYSKKPHLRRVTATLNADFPKPNPFMRFVRSQLIFQENTLYVEPSGLDKSGVVSSLSGADALMLLPGGTRGYERGMKVDVLLLDDHIGSEWPWDQIVASYK
ncbi:molybdopterin molybdotransferase MoeA [Halalkalibacter hemicellulosilyticus]|uniref:Molybdopterin molybdenumtransferase n=1 Tax=Halalkalibacter hemicellulosilyticusJCM 9152 TaxID=1236971 RepID=W4QKQ2_9BACI|nr:molybdopterin biosynthesis protein MoeA [Halalkalibacter hemicellulosilyticusJCM 9152]